MMRRSTKYIPEPGIADTPLTEEEVDEILDHRRGAPSGDVQVMHLLRRVKATIRATRKQVSEMNKHIAALTSRANAQGAPITMSVEDALRYASPDVVARHAPVYVRDQLDALHTWTQQVAGVLATAQEHDNRLRNAARIIFNDPGIPVDVRERFAALLRSNTPDQANLQTELPQLPPTPNHPAGNPNQNPEPVPEPTDNQAYPAAAEAGDSTGMFDDHVDLDFVDDQPVSKLPRREDLFAAGPDEGKWNTP